jgi:hypothetical protein
MTVALSATVAGSAQAVNVAGWDFSDFAADGVAGGTVDANYSSFDPTAGAGAESAAYGQASLTNLIARGGDVVAGVRTGVTGGEAQDANQRGFNAITTLQLEGQTYTNPMGITATSGAGDAVFEGDLTPLGAGQGGYGWSISFAGQVVGGSSATVDVEFAADCVSFSNVGSVNLDDEADAYTVAFPKVASDNACARLTIPNSGDERAVVDNVSLDVIAVPEPAVGAQLLAGFVGLVALFRRRAMA